MVFCFHLLPLASNLGFIFGFHSRSFAIRLFSMEIGFYLSAFHFSGIFGVSPGFTLLTSWLTCFFRRSLPFVVRVFFPIQIMDRGECLYLVSCYWTLSLPLPSHCLFCCSCFGSLFTHRNIVQCPCCPVMNYRIKKS
jgi:hypothetical protein